MPIRYGLLGIVVATVLLWLMPSTAKAQATATQKDTLSSIVVVPNPYTVVGRTWGPKSDVQSYERIRFANLPNTPATIKIYSSRGNLIITLRKPGNSESYLWDGRNDNNQYIVSDVYLYVVESPTLGRRVGKFIVIR